MTIAMVPGKVFDILDYKLYDWPGHGVPDDASYQYNEREWMKDDEYDLLINDPSNYWQRFYVPRMSVPSTPGRCWRRSPTSAKRPSRRRSSCPSRCRRSSRCCRR